jgi:hypothetical protein
MNQWEMMRRQEKAEALVAALVKCGATVEDVLNADAAAWELCAEAASALKGKRVNPPTGPETVALVAKLLERALKEVVDTTEVRTVQPEGGFGSPFEDYIPAQQEADEAVAAERKAEDKWEESQEYGENRCPVRE